MLKLESGFENDLLREVISNRDKVVSDNYDEDRFGPEERLSEPWITGSFSEPARNSILDRVINRFRSNKKSLERHVQAYSEVDYLYKRLNDALSRTILLKLFAYRILGYKRVRLPRNTE